MAATALLATAACTSGSDGAPPDSTFSDRALWRTDALGMPEPKHTMVVGDTVLLDGDAPKGGPRTIAVDAATGEVRWTLTDGHPVLGGGGAVPDHGGTFREPLVTGERTGDDWTLLIPYVLPRTERGAPERGLAAVSGADGRMLWKTRLVKAGEATSDIAGRVVGAHDALAVLAMPSSGDPSDQRVVAVDLKTRKKLWERSGLLAYAVAGETVVATTRYPSDASAEQAQTVRSVVGLNAKNGATRWSRKPEGRKAELVAATDQLTVFTQENEDGSVGDATVLDSTSGAERYRVDQASSCDQDADGLIACLRSRPGDLTVFEPDSGDRVTDAKRVGEKDGSSELAGVWNGRVGVSSERPDEDQPRHLLVDRDGGRLADELPGRPVALSPDYAAFTVAVDPPESEDRWEATTAIHRAGEGSGSRKPAADEPTTKPLGYDAKPLWSGATRSYPVSGAKDRELGVADIVDVRLVGDTLVYAGRPESEEDTSDRTTLVAVDLETGEPRWKVSDGDALGGGRTADPRRGLQLVGPAGQERLLISYQAARGPGGVAALSVADGELDWTVPYEFDERSSLPGSGPWQADAERFFVQRQPSQGDGRVGESGEFEVELGEPMTIAYDAATRDELWRAPGFRIASLAGERVVGERDGTVVSLDARTGKQVWAANGPSEVAPDQGGPSDTRPAVVVSVPDGIAVLDTATGRELARVGALEPDCSGTAEPLLVCRSGDPGNGYALVVEVTADGGGKSPKARVTPVLDRRPVKAYQAAGAVVVVAEKSGPGAPPEVRKQGLRYLMRDGAGRPLAEDPLPGGLLALNDTHAVFVAEVDKSTYAGEQRLTVHRRPG